RSAAPRARAVKAKAVGCGAPGRGGGSVYAETCTSGGRGATAGCDRRPRGSTATGARTWFPGGRVTVRLLRLRRRIRVLLNRGCFLSRRRGEQVIDVGQLVDRERLGEERQLLVC